jgi:hypothetical protein
MRKISSLVHHGSTIRGIHIHEPTSCSGFSGFITEVPGFLVGAAGGGAIEGKGESGKSAGSALLPPFEVRVQQRAAISRQRANAND